MIYRTHFMDPFSSSHTFCQHHTHPVNTTGKGGNSNETYFEDIRREIAIMKKLKHPNVCPNFHSEYCPVNPNLNPQKSNSNSAHLS